jgi:hypothetical protein
VTDSPVPPGSGPRLKPISGNCRAEYEDVGYHCEREAGHSGSHYFTHYVEWEGCWSCGRKPGEPHESPWCDAVEWGEDEPGELLVGASG